MMALRDSLHHIQQKIFQPKKRDDKLYLVMGIARFSAVREVFTGGQCGALATAVMTNATHSEGLDTSKPKPVRKRQMAGGGELGLLLFN